MFPLPQSRFPKRNNTERISVTAGVTVEQILWDSNNCLTSRRVARISLKSQIPLH